MTELPVEMMNHQVVSLLEERIEEITCNTTIQMMVVTVWMKWLFLLFMLMVFSVLQHPGRLMTSCA